MKHQTKKPNNRRISKRNLEFDRSAIRKNILSCCLHNLDFFGGFMTADKFVCRKENLLLCLGFSILIKVVCESQWIGRLIETDSGEGQRD